MIVPIEVTACRDCPHVTNSAREHNDPFTSEPYPTTWYCAKSDRLRYISDPKVIDAERATDAQLEALLAILPAPHASRIRIMHSPYQVEACAAFTEGRE